MFLANQDKHKVGALVRSSALPSFTAKSTTDPEAYLAELETVREQRIALDDEEYIADVRAVAAAIYHGRGNRRRLIAGVWTVGLCSGLDDEKIKLAAELTLKAADGISETITGRSAKNAGTR
jgi:DNA-binding IclR family transcriptional regulator